MSTSIKISVIVALKAGESKPQRLLDAYLRQTAEPGSFEVIFVDGCARTTIAAAVAKHLYASPATPMRVIEVDQPSRAAANNAGVRAARADLLLFVADDFIPGPIVVRAHVEFHRHLANSSSVGVGPAFFLDRLREDPFRRWLEDSGRLFSVPFRLPTGAWPADAFYAGNASMRRTLFDVLGGFDEQCQEDMSNDFEFGLRMRGAGVRTHYLSKAVAWHDHAVTMEERLDAQRRSGALLPHISERHGMDASWRPIMDRTLEDLGAAVLRAEEEERYASTPDSRATRFEALLDLAVAQGYRGAVAGLPANDALRTVVRQDA